MRRQIGLPRQAPLSPSGVPSLLLVCLQARVVELPVLDDFAAFISMDDSGRLSARCSSKVRTELLVGETSYVGFVRRRRKHPYIL
uniref:Uncharacterized protein n=1 Tax=Panstrongylus lignarius TaxID=156445 RepID=A0A224XS94_9HEMI